ncbi:MAG: hypothetical protein WKG07_03695, partial [Hymenobacter sp.]
GKLTLYPKNPYENHRPDGRHGQAHAPPHAHRAQALIPIAGKPIVQRLVEDIAKVCGEPVDEVAFIIGRFGAAVEKA